MRVLSGLRRLRLVASRDRERSGPGGRQARTYGPGRSSLVAKVVAARGPPLMSAARAWPPTSRCAPFRVARARIPKRRPWRAQGPAHPQLPQPTKARRR